jgi:uncharacterized membrane protein YedE/YeeE
VIRFGLWAFVSGVLFGVGLVVSGMTDPANIIDFLDVAGDFRPALALVMVGAVLIHAVALRLPLAAGAARPFASLRAGARMDAPLLLGSAIFGIGWGLGGYCPGPSIVALGSGRKSALVFVITSVLGVLLGEFALQLRERRLSRRGNLVGSTRLNA